MADVKKPRPVRATERGYADGEIREMGEEFVTTAPEGSWMEPITIAELHQGELDQGLRYGGMSLTELVKLAISKNVKDAAKLKKEDLIAALEVLDTTLSKA